MISINISIVLSSHPGVVFLDSNTKTKPFIFLFYVLPDIFYFHCFYFSKNVSKVQYKVNNSWMTYQGSRQLSLKTTDHLLPKTAPTGPGGVVDPLSNQDQTHCLNRPIFWIENSLDKMHPLYE